MSNCKTILIIEDDHLIRSSLSEVLVYEGYTVFTACNGQEGLDILAKIEKPALIFLDIMMPIMNGHEFLEHIRGDVAFAPIPVVVTSAHKNGDQIKGATMFLKKPLDLDIVLKAAKDHCG